MCKKALVNWAIWISVISGIYCAVYLFTVGQFTATNVLPGFQIVYATFTALPIYFTAGAKRGDFFKYICSYVVGVLWGMLYLWIMDRLAGMGIITNPWINIAVVVAVVCTIECALHFTVLGSLPFSVVPAQFGAISNTFWTSNMAIALLGPGASAIGGFYNFSAVPVLMLTLCTGTLLGLICNEGLNFIDAETGNWKWPSSKKSLGLDRN